MITWITPARFIRALLLSTTLLVHSIASGNTTETYSPNLQDAFAEAYFPELRPILLNIEDSAIRMEEIRANLLKEEEGIKATRSLTLPNVQLNGNLTYRQDIREDETRSEATPFNQATVTQPLYHWGALRARQSIAKIRADLAGLGVAETHRQLLHQVRGLYLDIVLLEERIAVKEKNLTSTRQFVDKVKLEVESERKAAIELQDAQLGLAEEILEIDEDYQLREHLGRLFELLSGQPVPTPAESSRETLKSTSFILDASQLDYLTSQANAFQPFDYVRKRKEIEIEEKQYTIIKSSTRPKVSAAVRYQVDQVGSENEDRQLIDTALVVSWNIFDGFETKHRKLRSKARQRELQAEGKEVLLRKQLDYKNRLSKLSAIAERVRIFRERETLTQALAETERLRYESGFITVAELLRNERRIREQSLRFLDQQIRYIKEITWLASEFGFDPLAK